MTQKDYKCMYNIYLPWPCMCVHTHAGNRTQVLSSPPYLLHRNMERQAPCVVTGNSARHLVLNRLNFSTSAYLTVSVVCVWSLVFSLCAGLREGRRCSGRPVGAGTQGLGSISLTQAQVLPNSKITAAVPEQLLRRSCCDISTWMALPFLDLPVQESHQVC